MIIENAPALTLPPPSLVNGEDSATYEQLGACIAAAVAPENVIEEILVRDVVDLVWDAVRLRRLEAGLFTVGASDGMAGFLRGLGEHRYKARQWAARKPDAVVAVNTQLSAAGLDMGDVTTIERMIAAAEVRRAAALNGIENRQVAERLRAAARDAERAAAPPVDEGEFTLVPGSEPDAAAHGEPARRARP